MSTTLKSWSSPRNPNSARVGSNAFSTWKTRRNWRSWLPNLKIRTSILSKSTKKRRAMQLTPKKKLEIFWDGKSFYQFLAIYNIAFVFSKNFTNSIIQNPKDIISMILFLLYLSKYTQIKTDSWILCFEMTHLLNVNTNTYMYSLCVCAIVFFKRFVLVNQ